VNLIFVYAKTANEDNTIARISHMIINKIVLISLCVAPKNTSTIASNINDVE
jgi:hypothetical protein